MGGGDQKPLQSLRIGPDAGAGYHCADVETTHRVFQVGGAIERIERGDDQAGPQPGQKRHRVFHEVISLDGDHVVLAKPEVEQPSGKPGGHRIKIRIGAADADGQSCGRRGKSDQGRLVGVRPSPLAKQTVDRQVTPDAGFLIPGPVGLASKDHGARHQVSRM